MKRIVITFLLMSSALAFPQSTVVSAPIVVSKPATYADIVSLWASGACSGFLKSDGTCGDSGSSGGGGGGISGLTTGYIPLAGSATTLTSNSHLNDGVTTASVITSSEQVTAPAYTTNGSAPGNISLAPGSGNIAALPNGSGGFAAPASGGTAYLFKLPATVAAGVLHTARQPHWGRSERVRHHHWSDKSRDGCRWCTARGERRFVVCNSQRTGHAAYIRHLRQQLHRSRDGRDDRPDNQLNLHHCIRF